MKGGSVAKRYATALIGVAQEQGKIDEIYQALASLTEQIRKFSDLKTALESPLVKPSQKKAFWKELQAKLSLDPILNNLVQILIDQKRVSLLPLITLIYRDMADEILGRMRVQIKTAASLGSSEEKLKSLLEKSLGCKVILEIKLDPSLLAGLIVQMKDQVFDASLKNDLKKLQESIEKKAVA